MNKYKVGDKVVMEITGVSKYGECYEVAHTSMWNTIRTERVTEPLSTYTEPLEAKIRRQAAEITRLLEENKELKEDKAVLNAKIDAYKLYGDQHEKAKDEIKVGDVYRSEVGNYFAIRTTDGEKGVAEILFMCNGEVTPDYIKSHCTKTGRHIDIDGFLKQIGEE